MGYMISKKGIVVDSSKVEVVLKWEVPKSIFEIRSFLGFLGHAKYLLEKKTQKSKCKSLHSCCLRVMFSHNNCHIMF